MDCIYIGCGLELSVYWKGIGLWVDVCVREIRGVGYLLKVRQMDNIYIGVEWLDIYGRLRALAEQSPWSDVQTQCDWSVQLDCSPMP